MNKFKFHISTLIYFILIIFFCFLIKWIWKHILLKLFGRRKLDNKILTKIEKGVLLTVFFSGLNILWERISLFVAPENPALEKFLMNIPKIIYSFLALSISLIAIGIFDGFTDWYFEEISNKTKTKVDEEVMYFFKRISRIAIFFIAITFILNKFNQPITSILGAAGIASFAIAFAAQDTLSNMISGFFIIIDKPFKIGDKIKLSTGEIGEVVEIGMRRTKLLSPENNLIIISNSEIAKTRIINFGFPDTRIRMKLKLGIQTSENFEKIKNLLCDICKRNPKILEESKVNIIEYNNSQIIFLLSVTINYEDEIEVCDWLIEEIRKNLETEKGLIFVKKE